MMYYEVGTDEGMYDAVEDATKFQKIKSLVIAGHGSIDSIQFGEGAFYSFVWDGENLLTREYFILDLSDESEMKQRIGSSLENGGVIITDSCSTGAGGRDADNIVNMLRRVFPQASVDSIYAPMVGAGIQEVLFNSEFDVVNVTYSTAAVYKASIKEEDLNVVKYLRENRGISFVKNQTLGDLIVYTEIASKDATTNGQILYVVDTNRGFAVEYIDSEPFIMSFNDGRESLFLEIDEDLGKGALKVRDDETGILYDYREKNIGDYKVLIIEDPLPVEFLEYLDENGGHFKKEGLDAYYHVDENGENKRLVFKKEESSRGVVFVTYELKNESSKGLVSIIYDLDSFEDILMPKEGIFVNGKEKITFLEMDSWIMVDSDGVEWLTYPFHYYSGEEEDKRIEYIFLSERFVNKKDKLEEDVLANVTVTPMETPEVQINEISGFKIFIAIASLLLASRLRRCKKEQVSKFIENEVDGGENIALDETFFFAIKRLLKGKEYVRIISIETKLYLEVSYGLPLCTEAIFTLLSRRIKYFTNNIQEAYKFSLKVRIFNGKGLRIALPVLYELMKYPEVEFKVVVEISDDGQIVYVEKMGVEQISSVLQQELNKDLFLQSKEDCFDGGERHYYDVCGEQIFQSRFAKYAVSRKFQGIRDRVSKELFIVKWLKENEGFGGHKDRDYYKREILAYFIGQGMVNVAEVRTISNEEAKDLDGIGSSEEGCFLVRIAQDYKVDELIHKDSAASRSWMLVFSILIGRYDSHEDNLALISNIPVYFDNDVSFDRTISITDLISGYYDHINKITKVKGLLPQEMKYEGYRVLEIKKAIKEFTLIGKEFPMLVEASGYRGKEARDIVLFLNDRLNILEELTEFTYKEITGRDFRGRKVSNDINFNRAEDVKGWEELQEKVIGSKIYGKVQNWLNVGNRLDIIAKSRYGFEGWDEMFNVANDYGVLSEILDCFSGTEERLSMIANNMQNYFNVFYNSLGELPTNNLNKVNRIQDGGKEIKDKGKRKKQKAGKFIKKGQKFTDLISKLGLNKAGPKEKTHARYIKSLITTLQLVTFQYIINKILNIIHLNKNGATSHGFIKTTSHGKVIFFNVAGLVLFLNRFAEALFVASHDSGASANSIDSFIYLDGGNADLKELSSLEEISKGIKYYFLFIVPFFTGSMFLSVYTPYVITVSSLFMSTLYFVVIEELIFRAGVYDYIKEHTNILFAFFISSLLFALAHFPLYGLDFIYRFPTGLVFTYAYYKTGSLKSPISCHLFNNLMLSTTVIMGILEIGVSIVLWIKEIKKIRINSFKNVILKKYRKEKIWWKSSFKVKIAFIGVESLYLINLLINLLELNLYFILIDIFCILVPFYWWNKNKEYQKNIYRELEISDDLIDVSAYEDGGMEFQQRSIKFWNKNIKKEGPFILTSREDIRSLMSELPSMIGLYQYIEEITRPYIEAVNKEILEAVKKRERVYTLYHAVTPEKALAITHMGNIYSSALEIPNIGNSLDVQRLNSPYLYSYFSGEFNFTNRLRPYLLKIRVLADSRYGKLYGNDFNNPISILGYGLFSAEVVQAHEFPEFIIKARKRSREPLASYFSKPLKKDSYIFVFDTQVAGFKKILDNNSGLFSPYNSKVLGYQMPDSDILNNRHLFGFKKDGNLEIFRKDTGEIVYSNNPVFLENPEETIADVLSKVKLDGGSNVSQIVEKIAYFEKENNDYTELIELLLNDSGNNIILKILSIGKEPIRIVRDHGKILSSWVGYKKATLLHFDDHDDMRSGSVIPEEPKTKVEAQSLTVCIDQFIPLAAYWGWINKIYWVLPENSTKHSQLSYNGKFHVTDYYNKEGQKCVYFSQTHPSGYLESLNQSLGKVTEVLVLKINPSQIPELTGNVLCDIDEDYFVGSMSLYLSITEANEKTFEEMQLEEAIKEVDNLIQVLKKKNIKLQEPALTLSPAPGYYPQGEWFTPRELMNPLTVK
ncbi:MAG: UPF0489 family protein, partial [Candidatus Omnitrophica bacterium]|nr:UPF0489 family protein [Candidatus Omnitrophota bacterium]